jgi:hypothetical protein
VFIDRGVVFEGTCTMAPLESPRPPPSPTLAMEAESLAPPTAASPTSTGGDEEAP